MEEENKDTDDFERQPENTNFGLTNEGQETLVKDPTTEDQGESDYELDEAEFTDMKASTTAQ